MLLSPKKLLPFLGLNAKRSLASPVPLEAGLGQNNQILSILLVFSLAFPAFAEAGFFSNFLKFFSADDGDVVRESRVASVSLPLLSSTSNAAASFEDDDSGSVNVTQDSSLVSPLNPLGIVPNNSSRDRIVIYRVEEGDTPSSIAKSFDISLNTLFWANNLKGPNLIRAGDELAILPVSGVKYEVKKGDTIESIAKKFKGDTEEILEFNGLSPDDPLTVGFEIIIPDGEFPQPPSGSSVSSQLRRFSSLPEFIGYYLRPILGGRNSRATRNNPRGLHGNNGVDLAASCGSPVLASAPGRVIIAKVYERGTRFGYGNYIVINHPNGTQTLYAHLSRLLVSAGQAVERGNALGLIGSSGNSTGCHVHFEVRGARNPF